MKKKNPFDKIVKIINKNDINNMMKLTEVLEELGMTEEIIFAYSEGRKQVIDYIQNNHN